MNKRQSSIDGFVYHQRSARSIGSPSNPQSGKRIGTVGATPTPIGVRRQPAQTMSVHKKTIQPNTARSVRRPTPRTSFNDAMDRAAKSELESSLQAIDAQDKAERKKASPEKQARRRKIIKRVLIGIGVLIIAGIGYLGVRAIIANNKSFRGSIFGFVQKAKLKQDANGRSNILIFGTSEDNDGGNHPGGNLTDSMMVLSINQTKKDAYMVSIPRDLWVKLDSPCSVGYEEKLNVVYMCASDDGKKEQQGADGLRKKIGEILGLDVQYYAHLNYKVVSDAVNAVGGVQVKIETDDPRGIYDPNFDWTCNHRCKMVNYKNGEVVTLDGPHALALARARNAQGGYGLSGGNFDRERNQQKILRALQEKALSAGTITNIGKVTGLIDALGNNLRTNVDTSEVRALLDLAKEIQGDKLQSIPLDKEGSAVVTTGDYQGRSIVRPVAGIFDYSGIKALIAKKFTDNPVVKEDSTIAIYNGSGIEGLAKRESDALAAKGVTIGDVGNAPGANRQITAIYKIAEGHTATQAMLEQYYRVKVVDGAPPVGANSGAQFVIILGTSAQQQNQ